MSPEWCDWPALFTSVLHVCMQACLTQVRSVPVTTRAIALSELRVQPPRVEELTSVEASLRLDAVASAGDGVCGAGGGFGMCCLLDPVVACQLKLDSLKFCNSMSA